MIDQITTPTQADLKYEKVAAIVQANKIDEDWCHIWLIQLISMREITHAESKRIWREVFNVWETPFD